MGGVLIVKNDRAHEFRIESANIYTPGQGICLQRLSPRQCPIFKFDHNLAYGSWYDIQIIGYNCSTSNESEPNEGEELRYLKKGIYLTHRKVVTVTELTDVINQDHGVKWNCSNCKKENIGSLAMCEYCSTNKAETTMKALSCVPIIGIPFAVTTAVLLCGKAEQSNTNEDKIDASLAVIFATVDVILAPFIVNGLIKSVVKEITEAGLQLTVKSLFSEHGLKILIGISKKLEKDAIVILAKIVKLMIEKEIKDWLDKKGQTKS